MNRTLQTRLAALEAQPSGGAVYFVEWAEDDPLSYTVAGEHVTAETYQALLQQTDDRAKEIKVIYADWRDRARRANDRQA